jgi:HSP20 family protein
MTLMRFDPFRELDRLTEQMFASTRAPRAVPMEAYRRDDQFLVHLDLPGVNPDDVELTVEGNVVTIRAQRRPAREEGDELLVDERPQGTFSRQLFLGDNLDASKLSASCDNGVLTLTIPVAEESKPRRVSVGGQQTVPEQITAESHEAEQRG